MTTQRQPDLASRIAAALADRYRLERELGQGGMATVYLAEDLKHRRRVAVKVLRPEYSRDEELLDRFQHEQGLRLSALRWARDREVESAARVVCPSAWLRELVIGWGIDPERVEVLPHALTVPPLEGREELRDVGGDEGRRQVRRAVAIAAAATGGAKRE